MSRVLRLLVGTTQQGYEHPCCPQHGALLSRALREAVALVADQSLFNPRAVLEAALVVTKIQKFFIGMDPKKAKRTHA